MSQENENNREETPPTTPLLATEDQEKDVTEKALTNDSQNNDNNMVDITDMIVQCAASLTMAEPFLCRRDTFQLQDAMAATQLMDRKMDSCEVPAHLAAPNVGHTDPNKMLFPRPCPDSLTRDPFVPLPWTDLTLEQASVVVTHQLVRLQALWMGASVGESIYTCLYAHKPVLSDMEEQLIVPSDTMARRLQRILEQGTTSELFCAQWTTFVCTCAIVEITEVFRGIVLNADIYEEEDFVSNTHDVPVFSLDSDRHPDKNSLQLYLETTVDLLRQLRGKPKLQILRLVVTYLNGTLLFCNKMGKLNREDLAETLDTMRRLAVSLGEGLKSLQTLLAERSEEEAARDKELTSQVFDSYTNRAMFGNTPVRKVSFLPLDKSMEMLLSVTREWDWAVCGLMVSGSSLARISRMLQRFSDLNILSRSLIVLNLYFEDMLLGKHALQSLIVAHMRQWEHVPADLVQNEHAQVLLTRLAKPIYDTLKVQCSNRNRQRAYIEAAMFQEWTSLQNEANLIDSNYRREHNLDNTTPPVFGFYVLSYLLRLMNQHLSCGVQVGLFCGHDEVCAAFWYRDFLLAALVKNLTQMRKGRDVYKVVMQQQREQQQQQQQDTAAASHSHNKGRKGKKKNHRNNSHKTSTDNGNKSQPQQPPPTKTLEEIEDGLELQMLEAKRKVCQGLVRFIVAIRSAGYFTFPDFEFTSRQTIFEQRFAVFDAIRQPAPLTFDDYLEGSNGKGISVQDMCQSASECFRVGRTIVERVLGDIGTISVPFAPVKESEARSLLKVCVGNMVYLMKFGQFVVGGNNNNNGSNNNNGTAPNVLFEFDFDADPEFCIVKVS